METKVRSIPIQEPYRKRWSEAKTIISKEELKESERNDSNDNVDGEATRTQNDLNGNIQLLKGLHPKMPDIQIHSQPLTSEESEGNCQGQGHVSVHSPFRTPQKPKCDYAQKLSSLNQEHHKSLLETFVSEKADWMLAERSNLRSPPSPAIGSRSPELKTRSPLVHMSPSVQTSDVFNFSPETTECYRTELETESRRRIKKNLFGREMSTVTQEIPTSVGYATIPLPSRSPTSHCHRVPFMSPRQPHVTDPSYSDHSPRDLTIPQDLTSRVMSASEARDSRVSRDTDSPFYLNSPSLRSNVTSVFSDTDHYRAKRRLDVDQEYVSTPKRIKIDLEREMGYKYIRQLESDIKSIQVRLHNQEPETEVKRPMNCTCAIMEKQFLEMAESAYRSVRRYDASPRGFEQFRLELIQTNEAMKDSMEVLKNIRSFCEHKC